MRAVIFLLSILSVTIFASDRELVDQDYSCVVTGGDKRYDDIFVAEFRSKGASRLKYKRIFSYSDGNYGPFEYIRGCYHGRQIGVEERANTITLECAMDGEEGSLMLDLKTLTGELSFYYPKIGYGERALLEVQCEEIK